MAHYRTTLTTTAPVTETFDHLADFASVAIWDPAIPEARLTSGEPGQVGARYAVVAQFGPRRIPLEYEVVARRDPGPDHAGGVDLVADGGMFALHDTITVGPTAQGTEVSYDAQLTLRGLARVMDIPLHLAFQVVGRRAESGLRRELDRLALGGAPRP